MVGSRESNALSSTSYDRLRFVSLEASERYEKLIVKKKPLSERGLRPSLPDDERVRTMIDSRHWESFCDDPVSAVLPLVHEFYANLPEGTDGTVWVRGKTVDFTAKAINAFFGVPDIEDDEYSRTDYESIDIEHLVRELCEGPSIQWKGACFRATALSSHAQMWNRFICARLLPHVRANEVTRERAALLHALVTTKSIDIGKIISAAMKRMLLKTVSGLWFPSLITSLCREAGVPVTDEMELVPVKPHISSAVKKPNVPDSSSDDGDERRRKKARASSSVDDGKTNRGGRPTSMTMSAPQQPTWTPSSVPLVERMRRLEDRCDELMSYAEVTDRRLEIIAEMLGCDTLAFLQKQR